jgi:hypothetical protein
VRGDTSVSEHGAGYEGKIVHRRDLKDGGASVHSRNEMDGAGMERTKMGLGHVKDVYQQHDRPRLIQKGEPEIGHSK